MRITRSMMTNTYLSNLNGNMNRLSKYLEQQSTGKAINRISDDPVRTAQSLSARNKLSGIERYQKNVSTAQNLLTDTEESVSELNSILQDAYEKAVYANSGTLNEDDLASVSEEIKALRDEVLSVANATYGGSYLFAGYNATGESGGALPFALDTTGDLYFNGVNMSNESSADGISAAAEEAAAAMDDASKLNTSIQSADISEYNAIVRDAASLADSLVTIASSAGTAAAGGTDIAASADVDPADAAALTGLSDTATSARDDLADAAAALQNAVAVGQAAADTAKEAHDAFDLAQLSGDSAAITEAQTAYNEAVAAAQSAAQDIKDLSVSAMGTASLALAAVNDMKAVADSAVSASVAALDLEESDVLSLQVGSGRTMEVSISGAKLLGRGSDNLYVILDGLYTALQNGVGNGGLSGYISKLQNAQSRVLSLEAEIGAKENRLKTLSARYEANMSNYKKMRSDAEDADLAEVITNYATAQTVYNAALSSGAEIIQTSLLDFLR